MKLLIHRVFRNFSFHRFRFIDKSAVSRKVRSDFILMKSSVLQQRLATLITQRQYLSALIMGTNRDSKETRRRLPRPSDSSVDTDIPKVSSQTRQSGNKSKHTDIPTPSRRNFKWYSVINNPSILTLKAHNPDLYNSVKNTALGKHEYTVETQWRNPCDLFVNPSLSY